jgi:predicted Zn finger-like uncharacterized protein
MVITVTCPSCSASFPVDPNKIPEGGVNVRCSSCREIFRVERPEEQVPPPAPEPTFEAEPEPEPEPTFEAKPEPEPLPTFEAEPEPLPTFEEPSFEAPTVDEGIAADSGGETDFAIDAEPAAAAEDAGGDWVLERAEDIDAGSLDIQPMETVESSVEEARSVHDGGPDLADPMALPAEPADSFFSAPTPEPAPTPEAAPEPDGGAAAPAVSGFSFGKRDPKDKARRLARVLVSDMISYNSERHERALANGSLKTDFEEEIQKSWKEYVEQVGEEMAKGNPFWTEALNDVLAKGEQIF